MGKGSGPGRQLPTEVGDGGPEPLGQGNLGLPLQQRTGQVDHRLPLQRVIRGQGAVHQVEPGVDLRGGPLGQCGEW